MFKYSRKFRKYTTIPISLYHKKMKTMLKLKANWEKIMNFFVCVGAAVVIFGALMKITHRVGADFFLTVGLLTESFIFLLYAFNPPPKTQPQGSLVEYLPKRLDATTNDTPEGLDEFNKKLSTANKNLADFNDLVLKVKSAIKS
jgi:hypothetical protein